MVRLVALFSISALVAAAQTPLPTWHDALHQIRNNVAQQIVRADNYICAQDVRRYYYVTKNAATPCEQPPHLPDAPLAMEDHLRLDVAVSEGNEIYAWHGDNKFSSKSLIDIVQRGPVSSGGFTGYLRNIFVAAGIEFTFHGLAGAEGERMYHFSYHVPQKVSRYQIKAANRLIVTPFHGSFTARADDLQLETLTVTADGETIPRDGELCAIQSTVIYKLMRISTVESLIPRSFDILYGSRNGTMTESKGAYSECRQYSGESTVRFDTDDDASNETTVEAKALSLRPRVVMRVALATQIHSDSAYAGMPVEGTLAHAVKLGHGEVLPVGSRVYGLLTRFETHLLPAPQVVLRVEFDRLVAANKTYLFRAIQTPGLYAPPIPFPGRRGLMQAPTGYEGLTDEEPGLAIFPQRKIDLDEKFVRSYETVPTT